MTVGVIEYDEKKFEELMLYVADLSSSDRQAGRTKLAKQLFNCDFRAYQLLGRPISGAVYRKMDRGPVPLPFYTMIDQLKASGRATDRRTKLPAGYKDLVALTALDLPNLDLFTPDEIDLVRDVVAELAPYDGVKLSELSHRLVGWQLAKDGEEIPYYTAFLDDAPPTITSADLARAQRFARA